MALIKCPECGKEISDSAITCPNCGCPAEIIKEKIKQQRIDDSKPKMVKACSCCGLIAWNKNTIGYKENYCLECNERNISHKLIELPVSCEDFEKKLYVKKNDSDSEINKRIDSIHDVERDIFEQYIEEWESLDITSETYQLNIETLYHSGKGTAHTAINNRVNNQLNSQKAMNMQSFIPKCPTCQSTDIKKISTASKAGSVFMWGLLSQKVKKQWHCNNCGSEW